MFERKSIIVYFRNPKVIKQLNQYGHVAYYHKKRRYAVIYVDGNLVDNTLQKLTKIRNVRKAEVSMLYDEQAPTPENVENNTEGVK